MNAEQMKNEILRALSTFGYQPSSVLTYAFGNVAQAVKELHQEGRIVKETKGRTTGWKIAR